MQYLIKFVLFEGRSSKFKIPPTDHYRKIGKSVYGGHGEVFPACPQGKKGQGGGEEKEEPQDRLK